MNLRGGLKVVFSLSRQTTFLSSRLYPIQVSDTTFVKRLFSEQINAPSQQRYNFKGVLSPAAEPESNKTGKDFESIEAKLFMLTTALLLTACYGLKKHLLRKKAVNCEQRPLLEDSKERRERSSSASTKHSFSVPFSDAIDQELHKPLSSQMEVHAAEDRADKEAMAEVDSAEAFFTEWNKELPDLLVFSGSANPELAREVCSHLGVSLGRVRLGTFADGEVSLELLDEVRGQNVFIIQSSPSASSNSSPHAALMELFFMVSAAKRSSAKHVTAILPYSRYFRQTIQPKMSSPLAGADMGQLLAAMGVDRVIFLDVHTERIDGLFHETIPVTNVLPQSLAVEYFKRKKLSEVVVVATENTGTEKALAFMSRMNRKGLSASMATLVSNRPERPQKSDGLVKVPAKSQIGFITEGQSSTAHARVEDWLVGNVKGKDCIIVDDIIDTADRAVTAAYALKHAGKIIESSIYSAGAKRIYMFATHGLFSKGAVERLVNSPIKEVVITDSIKLPDVSYWVREVKFQHLYCEKLRIISVSKLLAETIRRVHLKQPLSSIHRDRNFDNVMVEESTKQ